MQKNAPLVDRDLFLKNEYLLAKIGSDTAESGPKVDVGSNGLLVLLILSPLYRSSAEECSNSPRLAEFQLREGRSIQPRTF